MGKNETVRNAGGAIVVLGVLLLLFEVITPFFGAGGFTLFIPIITPLITLATSGLYYGFLDNLFAFFNDVILLSVVITGAWISNEA